MVVAPDDPTEHLLERVADARRVGATVFAIDGGDAELQSLAHESLLVPPDAATPLVTPANDAPTISFDVVTHLVSVAAADVDVTGRRTLRERLARLLDVVSGPET